MAGEGSSLASFFRYFSLSYFFTKGKSEVQLSTELCLTFSAVVHFCWRSQGDATGIRKCSSENTLL